jgi:hypothetical protein
MNTSTALNFEPVQRGRPSRRQFQRLKADRDTQWKGSKMSDADPDDSLTHRLKALNYLLVAQAAGFVTCLTLLKDFNTVLKGIGPFVWLFGVGLILAIIAVANLISWRQAELTQTWTFSVNWYRKVVGYSSMLSAVLLICAIIALCVKYGNL